MVEEVVVVEEFQEKMAQEEASLVENPWGGRLETQVLALLVVRSAVPPVVAVLVYTCWIQ
jgi:hypothetical protein